MVSQLEGQTPHSESPSHRPAMTTRWPIVVVALLAVLSAASESTNDGHPERYGCRRRSSPEVLREHPVPPEEARASPSQAAARGRLRRPPER